MPANTARRVRSKMKQYAADPESLAGNIRALKGEPGYLRLRVGDWRVVFSDDLESSRSSGLPLAAASMTRKLDMSAQIIVSPTGERLVVLPEAAYQALVDAAEDTADRTAVRRFKQRLAAGEEELLPAELVDRILDGENPIRAWREYRGFSVKALAEKAGIAPAYLSQVETGKRDGTVATVKKLADALGVTLDDLVG